MQSNFLSTMSCKCDGHVVTFYLMVFESQNFFFNFFIKAADSKYIVLVLNTFTTIVSIL